MSISALPIALEDLVHRRVVESSRVEFKASWDERTTGPQVLRTICAFANDLHNLNGGYIVLGVTESGGVVERPVRGLAPGEIEGAQRWIRGRCQQYLEPAYIPLIVPETLDDRHVLVIWAPGSDHRPHSAPKRLERGSPRPFWVRQGSDTVEAKDTTLSQLLEQTARIPFDDRRNPQARIEALSESQIREFLYAVGSKLVDEPDLRTIQRAMRLVTRINGHEVPRNVALLFFTNDPQEWFRGAFIEVVEFADEGDVLTERAFRGPLPFQLRGCLGHLRNLVSHGVEKVSDRAETRNRSSYPYEALEEVLVNAVYHRSYDLDVPEPIKVYVFPDRMEITSYPGPVHGIEPEHFSKNRRPPAVPARNRRIGDFLKELRLAEARNTGVPKIFREMERNGSPEPRFDFDSARTYFRVTLPAHPEHVAITVLQEVAQLKALGRRQHALDRLRRAFEARPESIPLRDELIEELEHAGSSEEIEIVAKRHQRAVETAD